MTGLWLISYVALWVLFLVVAIVLVSVLRNLGVIYESLEAMSPALQPAPTRLAAGDVLPDLTLRTLSGKEIDLSGFQGQKTAFYIVSPHCSPCRSLLGDIAENGKSPDPLDPSVRHKVIVSVGNELETAELIREIDLHQDPVLVDIENTVAREWGITSTPTTVIVDERLRVVRQVFGSECGPAIERSQAGLLGFQNIKR